MTEPRTSILLPAHNRGAVIGYSIRSILWQTDTDFELLIVGDGCTDNTAEVVASFADPRIRWFDLPKAPFVGYANRNLVLRQARGRFVAYAQDDDIMLPDHLELLVGTLEKSAADWAYSRPMGVTRTGDICLYLTDLTQPDQLDVFMNRHNTIPSCCVAHRRDMLERVSYWPEDVQGWGDWALWKTIIRGSGAGALAFCRAPTILHFQASWRAGPTLLEERTHAIAASGAWWPLSGRIPIADGVSEQASAFGEIAQNPQAWTARLRRDADAIVDRLAWAWLLPEMNTWSPPAVPAAATPPPPTPTPVPTTQLVPRSLTRALHKAKRRIRKLERVNARLKRNWMSPLALMHRLCALLLGVEYRGRWK